MDQLEQLDVMVAEKKQLMNFPETTYGLFAQILLWMVNEKLKNHSVNVEPVVCPDLLHPDLNTHHRMSQVSV